MMTTWICTRSASAPATRSSGTISQVLPPGTDPVDVYVYIYDSNGTQVYTTNAGSPAVADTTIDFTASSTGNYYVAISGMDLTDAGPPADSVDPFTGYWVTDDYAAQRRLGRGLHPDLEQ